MQDSTPQSSTAAKAIDRPIVFFDGDCLFCKRSVHFLLRLDDDQRLLFAPLQGETARRLLPEPLRRPEALDTMVLRDSDGRLFERSEAVARIMRHLGGIYSLAYLGGALPRAWRDRVYGAIAKRRKRLPAGSTCTMPQPADRSRFLP